MTLITTSLSMMIGTQKWIAVILYGNNHRSNSKLSLRIQTKMGGVMLCCPRNDCLHTWVTHSQSKHYVSCPYCRGSCHVVRDKVLEEIK